MQFNSYRKGNDSKQLKQLLQQRNTQIERQITIDLTGDSSTNTSNTPLSRKQLFRDLVQTIKIDNSKLLDQILKSDDVSAQIELFCRTVALNDVDLQNRIKLKNKLQELLHENGLRCELQFFGSTVNRLGFRDSDIDFFIKISAHSNNSDEPQQTAMNYLTRIQRIFNKQLKMFVPKPFGKRCPIVRLDFKSTSDDLKHTGIVCDLSLSNRLAVHNSKLISIFCDIESRFRRLALILRYWAKMNEIIGTQGFSSYTFTMLCVFFAQNTSPPLLPSVECLISASNQSLIIDGCECGFRDVNIDSLITEKNTDTVTQLIKKFFKFYSTFDFTTQVICPKTGKSVHKSAFVSQNVFNLNDTAKTNNKLTFNLTPICCIQDPIELHQNLTAHCQQNFFSKFCESIRNIANNSEKLFPVKQNRAQNIHRYWGIARLITEFDRNNSSRQINTRKRKRRLKVNNSLNDEKRKKRKIDLKAKRNKNKNKPLNEKIKKKRKERRKRRKSVKN